MSDDVRERVWVVSDNDTIDFIIAQFKNIPSLYIADGHHRAASAVKVGLRRREQIRITREMRNLILLIRNFPERRASYS